MSVTVSNLMSREIALYLAVVLAMMPISLAYGSTSESSSHPKIVASIPLNWNSLELQDAGVTGSVTTRIELRKPSAADVLSTLVDGPNQKSQGVAGKQVREIAIGHSIRLLLGAGIETLGRLWFNEDDGLPLQLIRTRKGSRPSQKLYRFSSNQVYRLRRKPRNRAETRQPPEHWSKLSESFYPLPDLGEECPAILESSQLLYLLSNPDYAVSEKPRELCVFDRKRVYQVGFRVMGREQVNVDYRQVAAGHKTRVRRTFEAIHVVLTGRPLEGTRGEVEPFSFLGLKDEIHLLFSDPERIPLRIRGQVPGFGMIDLELKKLTR